MQLIKLEIRPNGIAVLVIGFCDPTYELPLLLWYTPNTGFVGKAAAKKSPNTVTGFLRFLLCFGCRFNSTEILTYSCSFLHLQVYLPRSQSHDPVPSTISPLTKKWTWNKNFTERKINLPLSRKRLEQDRLSTSTALPKATKESGTLERKT